MKWFGEELRRRGEALRGGGASGRRSFEGEAFGGRGVSRMRVPGGAVYWREVYWDRGGSEARWFGGEVTRGSSAPPMKHFGDQSLAEVMHLGRGCVHSPHTPSRK